MLFIIYILCNTEKVYVKYIHVFCVCVFVKHKYIYKVYEIYINMIDTNIR